MATEPRYRIQTVERLTRVPAATLRSWERRYSIPMPKRTASSYRLYSDADVKQVQQMRRLVGRGMAASEAALAVQRGEEPDPPTLAAGAQPADRAIERLIKAALDFDPEAAHTETQRAATLGDALTVYDDIITPALRRVGELWEAGDLTVAQEHAFSHAVEHVLRDMLRFVNPSEPGGTMLIASIADEQHTLGLYGVALRAASWGLRSVILGARTPPDALRDAVERLGPDLVGLSATIVRPEQEAMGLAREYAAAAGSTPWVVGGRASEVMRAEFEGAGAKVVGIEPDTLRAGVLAALRRR